MNPAPLSEYESRIVQDIAAWKAEPPGLFTRVTSKLTMSVTWTLQHVILEAAARSAVETASAASDWLASPADLLQRGGVKSVVELQHKELKLSDRLADHVASGSHSTRSVQPLARPIHA